ncbi:P-loop containing nucleoside triphosphate hydrolases superfamily protein [Rhynchospora pubera]|uniref:P-loop containing nucleoside triphosphate hydrolases superfamily protein n=1 Tax=Rhynchospora pubera TaxID=906938 RepID=A0AAV8HV08_9POAL|nr:P-loop containing nucleoside triphosphate hydrolases superfamily protein [Rhynchospora pubera]
MLLRVRPFPSFPPLSTSRFSASAHATTAASSPTTPTPPPPPQPAPPLVETALFIPPGVAQDEVSMDMVLPGSNIVIGPYAGDSKVKSVEFVKSSAKAKDCPRDPLGRPEFAVLGRSNVGKSSLINSLVRKKEVALTSKKPGKTQLINHFLINKSWYLVDLPGYGFAHAPRSAKTDWSAFTKGYFLNRDSLVSALLLIDSSVPPQQIDLDCANWLGRNNIGFTFVFTKCDKVRATKGKRSDDNLKKFQDLISNHYQEPPPWIMTSSVTGLGRDDLLLHMSQLRNYWDQEAV